MDSQIPPIEQLVHVLNLQSLQCPGLPVLLTEEEESVLLGSAILAAAAAGDNVMLFIRLLIVVLSFTHSALYLPAN